MARFMSLGVIIGLVVVFGLLSIRVMASFLLPLLLAAMLVVVFGPLHRWLRERLSGPAWLAAGLTTLCVFLLVFAPLGLIAARAIGDAVALFRGPSEPRLDPLVLERLVVSVNETTGLALSADSVNNELRQLAERWIGPIATGMPVAVAKMLIGLVVMTVSFFYFLLDGRRMTVAITRLIPLDERYQWQFLAEFEEISRAVVSSTLLAALVQAGLAGIGYAVAGLEGVFLLTILTFFGAMVPFIGAAMIWGLAALYLLFFEQQTWAAIGLALWGGLVVSTIDNVVKPVVLQGQSKLHPLLALLSVLGGVGTLGPIGVFVGPIVVAFLQAALTMLQAELSSMSGAGLVASGLTAAGENKPGVDPTNSGEVASRADST
jgi:predicted PurR-regulated permease PerM